MAILFQYLIIPGKKLSKIKKIKELSEGLKVRVTRIGVINNQKGLEIVGYNGPKSSYQHF